MDRLRTIVLVAAALLAAAASAAALAHGGGFHHRPRVSVGFVFGGPAFWGYPAYYYPYPYNYPRAVGVPAEPTVYIERGDASAPPAQAQDYWYYCPEAKAYYPYVKHCAGPWQRVAPQPPGG
ncbi:MAG: hypothetical protein ACREUB_01075 [Burkholderiales bacterium]